MSCGSACLAISKGADVSKLRDPVRNRQKQKTKHKIAVEAVHNHADMQKNKEELEYDSGLKQQKNVHTEDRQMERENVGPVLIHQHNHASISNQSNFLQRMKRNHKRLRFETGCKYTQNTFRTLSHSWYVNICLNHRMCKLIISLPFSFDAL